MGFPIHCQGENIAGTLQLNLQWWGCVWGVVVDSKQNFFSRLKPLQNVVLNDGSLVRYPTPWKTFREVGTWDVHKPLLVGYTIELRCYEIPWVSIKIHRFTNKKNGNGQLASIRWSFFGGFQTSPHEPSHAGRGLSSKHPTVIRFFPTNICSMFSMSYKLHFRKSLILRQAALIFPTKIPSNKLLRTINCWISHVWFQYLQNLLRMVPPVKFFFNQRSTQRLSVPFQHHEQKTKSTTHPEAFQFKGKPQSILGVKA